VPFWYCFPVARWAQLYFDHGSAFGPITRYRERVEGSRDWDYEYIPDNVLLAVKAAMVTRTPTLFHDVGYKKSMAPAEMRSFLQGLEWNSMCRKIITTHFPERAYEPPAQADVLKLQMVLAQRRLDQFVQFTKVCDAVPWVSVCPWLVLMRWLCVSAALCL